MRTLLALAAFAALAAACDDRTALLGRTSVVIDQPADGSTVFSLDTFTFHATASGNTNITSLILRVGAVELARCPGNDTGDEISCSAQVDPRDYAGQMKNGQLTVSAAAKLDTDEKMVESTVLVKPLRVAFRQPTGANPVLVHGTSSLELDVASEVPVNGSVTVTYDNGVPLRDFPDAPYQADIDWIALVGAGDHTLEASATDTQARSDTARLKIRVGCEKDVDCDGGQKCCPASFACVAKTAACQ